MIARYIDTHCHLQFEQYAADREEIIAKMQEEGIAGIVVGTDEESSQKAILLAEKHEHLYATVGFHPGNTMRKLFDDNAFRALAKHPKVVAIGECGLEYFHTKANDEEKTTQKELFKKHIALAVELDKPLMIHARPSAGARDAYEDLIEILKEAKTRHPNLRGNIHFFAGTLAEAEAFLALDFTISFTSVITFARNYDAVIRAIPLANILSETDAPFVAPANRRGERNDPLAVIEVVEQIAAIRGENHEFVRQTLLSNAERQFALQGA
jgi:TatD DNase family protein